MSVKENRAELLRRLDELGLKLHTVAEDLISGKVKAREANLAVKRSEERRVGKEC